MPNEMNLPTYAEIQRINYAVNRAVGYVDDVKLYQRPEFWELATSAGDCEDYALAKRRALLALGVDPTCLRLAVVFSETEAGQQALAMKRAGLLDWGGDHAVLVVRCADGSDYMLDNRYDQPILLSETLYTVDRIQVGYHWEHVGMSMPTKKEPDL